MSSKNTLYVLESRTKTTDLGRRVLDRHVQSVAPNRPGHWRHGAARACRALLPGERQRLQLTPKVVSRSRLSLVITFFCKSLKLIFTFINRIYPMIKKVSSRYWLLYFILFIINKSYSIIICDIFGNSLVIALEKNNHVTHDNMHFGKFSSKKWTTGVGRLKDIFFVKNYDYCVFINLLLFCKYAISTVSNI